MHNNNYYTTSSLALATSLQIVSKAKIEFLQRWPGSNKVEFVFDSSKDSSFYDLVALFWARNLLVDASTYFETLKQLKTRLYEEKASNVA